MTVQKYKPDKTGRPRWQINVNRTIDGETRRASRVVTCGKYDAGQIERKMLSNLEREMLLGTGPAGRERVSFGDIVETFLQFARMNKKSYRHDEWRAAALLEFFGEKTPAAAIKRLDCDRFYYERMKAPVNGGMARGRGAGRLASAATARQYLALLKRIYNYAVDNELVEANPAARVRPVPVDNFQTDEIDRATMSAILYQATPVHAWVFFWARWSGLRLSHLLGLQAAWINDGILKAPATAYAPTKKIGRVPVPENMIEGIPGRPRKAGGLFYWHGKPIKSVRTAMENSRAKIGTEKEPVEWKIKTLRTTFATWLQRAGVRPAVISAIMGHSRVTVADRYQVVSDEEIKEVGKLIEADPEFRAGLTACELIASGRRRCL